MASNDPTKEILDVANHHDLSEVGGGHGQKGVDFQRYWALMRIFELEEIGKDDYLFLFETIQDVAEFDSSYFANTVRVYQVKKKDRGEWTWTALTNLPKPIRRKPIDASELPNIKASSIGKLYASVIAFKQLACTGYFISNAGCDLPLHGGGNAATSLPCSLSSIEHSYQVLLSDGLKTLHASGLPLPDLDRMHIKRVSLPPDDPRTHLIGVVANFLDKRSPRHAGQARALVDSLMAKIGPLGTRTDVCKTFDEMKAMRGFSREELKRALSDLEDLPDLLSYLDQWLIQLGIEGVNFMERTSIKAAATAFYRRQVIGSHSKQERELLSDIDNWLAVNRPAGSLSEYFEKAHGDIGTKHTSFNKPDLLAYFALGAIRKCVDRT